MLSDEEKIELINLMFTLNMEITSKEVTNNYDISFNFLSNGYYSAVTFCDFTVWDSENDEHYETLDEFEEHIRERTNDILINFGKLQF